MKLGTKGDVEGEETGDVEGRQVRKKIQVTMSDFNEGE